MTKASYFVLHREPTVVFAQRPWHEPLSDQFRINQHCSILASAGGVLRKEDVQKAIQWGRAQRQKFHHYIEFVLDFRQDAYPFGQANLNVTQIDFDALRDERVEFIEPSVIEKLKFYRERFLDAVRQAFTAAGVSHDPAFDLYHLFRDRLLLRQSADRVLKGGDEENRTLLHIAAEEPHTRKLWAPLSGAYWENPLPQPA